MKTTGSIERILRLGVIAATLGLPPVPVPADDPRMVALLSYIHFERRGVPLSPGKH